MRFSTTELLVVLVIVIVLFGPKQIPKLSKMLGSSIKSFKKGLDEDSPKEEESEEDGEA